MNHHQTALFLVYRIILRKNLNLQTITSRNARIIIPKQDENNQVSESAKDVQPEEVNALYERLLQEMESKTKKLNDEQKIIGTVPNGRDY